MSKIRIKNFGPIKDGVQGNDGWLDINKVTVFIGNQGSGKSTVAKLISTFAWIEKALVRGDYDAKWFEYKNRLQNQYLSYHRIDKYIYPNTLIEYQGEAYSIKYKDGFISIEEKSNTTYPLPQIMYVPAERNFLTYVRSPKELRISSESLQEYSTEYYNAENNMSGAIQLPINGVEIEYNKRHDMLYLKGRDYKIKITDAASGYQSFIPLYLVSRYLANSVKMQSEAKVQMNSEETLKFQKGVQEIWSNDSLTDEQKRAALSVLSSKFNKTAFINIVEEPEQNLFPSSQWQMLQSLLEFNNMNEGNKLILTTHSPYLISYLTLAIQAGELQKLINTDVLKDKLQQIVPLKSMINPADMSIYELEETHGIINTLATSYGIPSDDNKLNKYLEEGNELFAQLLEIQQQL